MSHQSGQHFLNVVIMLNPIIIPAAQTAPAILIEFLLAATTFSHLLLPVVEGWALRAVFMVFGQR